MGACLNQISNYALRMNRKATATEGARKLDQVRYRCESLERKATA
jgi:hypothetical protein